MPDPILGMHSGLFVAAPRRTDKSTFLRRDLVPLMEAGGVFTIHVDLWSDRDADPGWLITGPIASALNDVTIALERTAKMLLPKSISVGGIAVDLAQSDGIRVATLSKAL